MKRYDDGTIYDLEPNEYIVIGTNIEGNHAGGAAKYAKEHFGLQDGVGRGLSGQTYALPTMDGIESIRNEAIDFITFASTHPTKIFYLTRVGCGIAGHKDEDIALFFKNAPKNVIQPTGWNN